MDSPTKRARTQASWVRHSEPQRGAWPLERMLVVRPAGRGGAVRAFNPRVTGAVPADDAPRVARNEVDAWFESAYAAAAQPEPRGDGAIVQASGGGSARDRSLASRVERLCVQYPKGTVFYRGAASMVQFNANLTRETSALEEYQKEIRSSGNRFVKLTPSEERALLERVKAILMQKTIYGTNNVYSDRVPAEESVRLIVTECRGMLPGPYPLSKIVRSLKKDDAFLLDAKERGARYDTIRPKLERIGDILERIESGAIIPGDGQLVIPPHGFAAQMDDVFFFTQDRALAKIYARDSKELVKFTVQRPFKLLDLSRFDVVKRLMKGEDAPFSSTIPNDAQYEYVDDGFVKKRWVELAKSKFRDRLDALSKEMKSLYRNDLEQSAYMAQMVLTDLRAMAQTREFPVFSPSTPDEQWSSSLDDCRVIVGQLLRRVPIIMATLNELAIEMHSSSATVAFMLRLEKALDISFELSYYRKHILNTEGKEPKNVFQGYLDALYIEELMPAGLRAVNSEEEVTNWKSGSEISECIVKAILRMRFKRLRAFMREWNDLVYEEFGTYIPIMNDKMSEQEKIEYDVRSDPRVEPFLKRWLCSESNNCLPVSMLSNDYAPSLPSVESGVVTVPWHSVKGLWISTNMKLFVADLSLKRRGEPLGVDSLARDSAEWRAAHFRDSYYVFDELLLRALWRSPMMNPVNGVVGWMHPEPFEICVKRPERYGVLEWEPVDDTR
jgi:hypothetical protein